VSKYFTLRIDNRHILRAALAMVIVGMLVPGGFGVKPPQWLQYHDDAIDPTAELDNGADVGVGDSSGISAEKMPQAAKIQDKDAVPALATAVPPAEGLKVAPKFAKHIPAKHLEMTGDKQKQSFINLVLPLILAANDEIRQRRAAILVASEAQDRTLLDQWAELYRINPNNVSDEKLLDKLLKRVDTIPVPLALAQAVVESGWGTSRFAVQGNALFGQWAWSENAGMRPLAASNDRAVVRSFSSLLESVRAYMHNLNTHRNYRRFREARQRLDVASEDTKAGSLVAYLDRYAEIGKEYVTKISVIIKSNNLTKFADAELG
jgi:uncharacterized FlgJ-related protein